MQQCIQPGRTQPSVPLHHVSNVTKVNTSYIIIIHTTFSHSSVDPVAYAEVGAFTSQMVPGGRVGSYQPIEAAPHTVNQ